MANHLLAHLEISVTHGADWMTVETQSIEEKDDRTIAIFTLPKIVDQAILRLRIESKTTD